MAKKDKAILPIKEPEVEITQEPVELVEFETWFASRGPKIPRHHYREILKADFKARGLKDMASMKDFDEALTMYGVKLA